MLAEVGAYLETQGLGTLKTSSNNPSSWPIFLGGVFPANVDEVIALAEGPSDPPIDTMGSTVGAVVAEQASLVVQVRSEQYDSAEAKARAIWNKLHKLGNTSLSGTRYLLIMARHAPFPIGGFGDRAQGGRDAEGRWILNFNCSVTKEKS
jgi:hypothetical protein